jgi:hypothetical protein
MDCVGKMFPVPKEIKYLFPKTLNNKAVCKIKISNSLSRNCNKKDETITIVNQKTNCP